MDLMRNSIALGDAHMVSKKHFRRQGYIVVADFATRDGVTATTIVVVEGSRIDGEEVVVGVIIIVVMECLDLPLKSVYSFEKNSEFRLREFKF